MLVFTCLVHSTFGNGRPDYACAFRFQCLFCSRQRMYAGTNKSKTRSEILLKHVGMSQYPIERMYLHLHRGFDWAAAKRDRDVVWGVHRIHRLEIRATSPIRISMAYFIISHGVRSFSTHVVYVGARITPVGYSFHTFTIGTCTLYLLLREYYHLDRTDNPYPQPYTPCWREHLTK